MKNVCFCGIFNRLIFIYLAWSEKVRRTAIISIILMLTLVLGCGGSGTSEPINSIKIESITPATQEVNTTFTITVSYDLQTADKAAIMHCFSDYYFGDRASDYWIGCPMPISDGADGTGSAGIAVYKGQGTMTITGTRTLDSQKFLYVHLVPNSTSTPIVGIVSDARTIAAQ